MPSLWIRNDGADYAIAHVDNACESLDVCFRNRHNADYRLTLDAKNLDFSVLQLVDHATGEVIDLKQQPDYSFHANGTEVDGRFNGRVGAFAAEDEPDAQRDGHPFAGADAQSDAKNHSDGPEHRLDAKAPFARRSPDAVQRVAKGVGKGGRSERRGHFGGVRRFQTTSF